MPEGSGTCVMASGASDGRLCGKYELIRQIGEGGMATVYRAYKHGADGFKREVAIKRVRDEHRDNPHFRELFVEEARVDAVLRNPNIVHVYDFDRDESGAHFLVTEWIEGLALNRYLGHFAAEGRRAPADLVGLIIRDVLHALDAAHGHRGAGGVVSPIYHRDITPHNILLDVSGVAKLADFGMARAMDRGRMTNPDIVKGKLSYMAPEMTRGIGPNVRTDLFAVGIVMWEALTGKRLFQADSDVEVFKMLMNPQVPAVASERADLPPGLAAVVDRVLSAQPHDRFASAFEMLYALDDVLRALPRAVHPQDLARSVRETAAALASEPEAIDDAVVEGSVSVLFEPVEPPTVARAAPGAGSKPPLPSAPRPPAAIAGLRTTSAPPPLPTKSGEKKPAGGRAPKLREPPVVDGGKPAPPGAGSHPPRLPKLPPKPAKAKPSKAGSPGPARGASTATKGKR